jgi:hypothetical protein
MKREGGSAVHAGESMHAWEVDSCIWLELGSLSTHSLTARHWAAARDPPHAASSSLTQAALPLRHAAISGDVPSSMQQAICCSALPRPSNTCRGNMKEGVWSRG